MDPRTLGPAQWEQIARVVDLLYLSAGLTICAALAFLLGQAILPSLAASGDAPNLAQVYRPILSAIVIVSALLTVVALIAALVSAVDVIRYVYPAFLV